MIIMKRYQIISLLLICIIFLSCSFQGKNLVFFRDIDDSVLYMYTVDYWGTVNEPSAPTREGVTFLGWYTSKEFDTEFDFSKRITKETDIYAKWDIPYFTVTFITDNNLNEVFTTKLIYYNGVIKNIETPEKEGCSIFDGWFIDSECENVFDLSTPIISDFCLYAKWKEYHSFDNGVITMAPTCTEKGVKTYTCKVCGETKVEDIEPTGHSFDKGVITKEPTCTEKGVKTYTCKVCGETKVEDIELTGHSFDEGVITKEPTCTENGIKTYTCTVCGEQKTEEIEATGHNYDGLYCTKCGHMIVTALNLQQNYTDVDNLQVCLNTFTHTTNNGYNNYSINYTLTNSGYGSDKSEGIFKIIYKLSDGTYETEYQYGMFDKVYYGTPVSRTYTWKLSSEKVFVCLEYVANSQTADYIFSSTPSANLLNWIIEN